MKITDIKPYAVWVGRRNQMLVKIETDEGIYGWGESGFSGRELGVRGIIEHYREFLIGKDPMKRGALWQEMYRSQYFEGGRTLTHGAHETNRQKTGRRDEIDHSGVEESFVGVSGWDCAIHRRKRCMDWGCAIVVGKGRL